MKQANGETTMSDEEGVTYSPSEIGNDWVFTGDAQNTMKAINKIRREKGKKSFSLYAGLTSHFGAWVDISFKELRSVISDAGDKASRFRNCTITLNFHIKKYVYCDGDIKVSIWPTSKRNENLNAENNWGQTE